MKVTVISLVVDRLGTVPKDLEDFGSLKIRGIIVNF